MKPLEYIRLPDHKDWISHGYIKQKSDDKHGIDCLILILLIIVLSGLVERLILS